MKFFEDVDVIGRVFDTEYSEELKKPDMNKPVFKMFPKAKKAVEEGKCPDCGKEIKEEDFSDDLSKKEYSISGLCQSCQKQIFGEEVYNEIGIGGALNERNYYGIVNSLSKIKMKHGWEDFFSTIIHLAVRAVLNSKFKIEANEVPDKKQVATVARYTKSMLQKAITKELTGADIDDPRKHAELLEIIFDGLKFAPTKKARGKGGEAGEMTKSRRSATKTAKEIRKGEQLKKVK